MFNVHFSSLLDTNFELALSTIDRLINKTQISLNECF